MSSNRPIDVELTCISVVIYLDETIMKKKAKGGRDGDKGLLELGCDSSLDDVFYIRANVGVVVVPELSRGHMREET